MACDLYYISSITGDCSNLSLGGFSIEIRGYAPDYAIEWISPDYGTIALGEGVTEYTINGLLEGTYTFNILDSCNDPGVTVLPVNINISNGTCVSIINQQNTTCNFNNGAITAATSYNYGNASYYLYESNSGYLSSGSTENLDFSFYSLSAGTYYVIADDGGGCSGKSETCIIKSSTNLDYDFYVVNDAGCNVSSGKIFITGLTGTPPYTYLWSNGGTLSSITGLTNGSYSVAVTDSTGCVIPKSASVVKVPQIGLGGFQSISPSCAENNGELTVFVTGGTAPYYYSGSTGESNISFDSEYKFTNIPGGTFSVYVQDTGLCSFVASTTIQTPSGFNVTRITLTNSKCSNDDGNISIELLGTNGNIIYKLTNLDTFNFDENTTPSLNHQFAGLKSGTYLLTITNRTCVYNRTITVINESLYTINVLTTGTTCNGLNGSVNIEVVGGQPPYTIDIGSQSIINTPLSSVTFTNLVSDSYTVSVKDSSLTPCQQTKDFEIDSSEGVGFILVKTDSTDGSDGTINVLITGGTPTFDLQWSPNVNGQTGYSITNLDAGTYTLTVTDSNNCVKESSITIYGYDKLSSYESYTICDSDFENIGVGEYGIYQMYSDGYYTLVSGFTNCVLDMAIFSLIVTIGDEEKFNDFYTSYLLNDYPYDDYFYSELKGMVDSFDQIGQTIIDPIDNQIKIITKCDEESLVPNHVVIELRISYTISCQYCGLLATQTPTPTPTLTKTSSPTRTPTKTPTNTPTPTNTLTPGLSPSLTPTKTPTPTVTPSSPKKYYVYRNCSNTNQYVVQELPGFTIVPGQILRKTDNNTCWEFMYISNGYPLLNPLFSVITNSGNYFTPVLNQIFVVCIDCINYRP